MSDLTITNAGVSVTPKSAGSTISTGKYSIVRVTPTISATAYADGDVLFLTTEIPNAVRGEGGYSKLIGVTIIDQGDQVGASADFDLSLLFMGVQKNLIGAISPGSSGGVAISDANLEAANILGGFRVDASDNVVDLATSSVTYMGAATGNAAGHGMPMLLKAESGSTSVYFAGIAHEALDFAATDDLDFVFHIEH